MKRIWVLAVWSVLSACGHAASSGATAPGDTHATPASCDAIVAHLATVFGQKELAVEDHRSLVEACEKDQPPPAERACVMAAQTPADVDNCGREGAKHPPAPPPAPTDPREDLKALADHVARYHQELGEWPPEAPATPAAGTCCAAACPADSSLWVGPWQLVRYGLEHATSWSFAIERRDDGATAVVRAIGCPGAASYELVVAPGAEITETH
ncbi:MAG TPA: hypothetical protein VL463_31725 [Kofleriaceae bacterium]|nr:hypothetical protein [Kofleriaceae bacterium]